MKKNIKSYIKRVKDAVVSAGIYSEVDDIVIEQAGAALKIVDEELDDQEKMKAMTLFMKYAYQLGLTPIARRNLGVSVSNEEPKENPFAKKKLKKVS